MNKPFYILGVAAFYHDSSACLLCDGELVSAAQEERFTRKKQDEDFPKESIKYCLDQAGITISDLDAIVFYEKPLLKFERLLQSYIKTWPWGVLSFLKAMKSWLSQKLWLEHVMMKELELIDDKNLYTGKIYYTPHHLSHGASSYFTSGLSESLVLTVDGVGEWSTTTIGYGKNKAFTIEKEIVFPDSLGLLYSAFTYYLGFRVNSAEYKVMGLAPYGTPKYKDKIYEVLEVFDDGSFRLKPQYFSYEYGLRMVNKKFIKHFGKKLRVESDELTQWHKDMAASLQKVTEELMFGLVSHAKTLHPECKNLCLSGGVALNCVSNGKILRECGFDEVYIFPASGDAGGSVGAAFYLDTKLRKQKLDENYPKSESIYLGPEFKNIEIEGLLKQYEVEFTNITTNKNLTRAQIIAQKIADNKVIGLFQGRMEFGPRALGNRSIIADSRQSENWKRVNLKIKFRESFRPFAPSVLLEKADEIFELNKVPSPYMLLTTQVKVEGLPAITHTDNSARVQTVSKTENPDYHAIISAFDDLTGTPVIINTSFNVRGEPIVCTPLDALKGYLRTDMDVLVLGDFMVDLEKSEKEKLKAKLEQTLEFETFEKD